MPKGSRLVPGLCVAGLAVALASCGDTPQSNNNSVGGNNIAGGDTAAQANIGARDWLELGFLGQGGLAL
jgi:hypothetical protein